MGALALTGQQPKRAPFEPLPPGVSHVPYGDVAALAAAVDGDTAAVVLEPILGEAGVIVPPEGYLRAAREITAARGALLVIDEVQTGIGRTGAWFAHQAAGIVPDVVTLAKGLGGGLPIGACIGIGDAGRLLEPGQHGTTFGGNPVCCAAALAVLDTIAARGSPGARPTGRQGDRHRDRGAGPPARHRRQRGRADDRGRARAAGVRGGHDGRPGGGLPGQQRGAGPRPADPAARADRGPGRRVPRRAARRPRRRQAPRRRGRSRCPCATSCATTTSRPPSRPRSSTSRTR